MGVAFIIFNLAVCGAFYCIGVVVGIEKAKRGKVKDYRKF